MKLASAGASLLALSILATPVARAHHAFSMYDYAKTVALKGTVKSYVWANPHTMMDLVAVSPNGGATEEWTVELSSPNIIGRRGWSPQSIKAGDAVALTVHPMRDGRRICLLMSATLPSGQVLHDTAGNFKSGGG